MTVLHLDRWADIDSPLHKLDPRAKVLATLAAVVTISSAPSGSLTPFTWFYALIALLVGLSRVPPDWLLRRCLLASPFILMAAALPAFSLWLEGARLQPSAASIAVRAAVIALKAYAAVILLALLVATTRFSHLLWALRALRAPEVLHVMAGLMHRYAYVLADEWRRTNMARDSRAGATLSGRRRLQIFSQQIATIFLRGWDRATRIHWAMLSRGFTGAMPVLASFRFGLADWLFLLMLASACVSIRWRFP